MVRDGQNTRRPAGRSTSVARGTRNPKRVVAAPARLRDQKAGQGGDANETGKDHEIARLEQRLSERVGSPVTIEVRSDCGYKLDADTPNLDVLEGILEKPGFDTDRVR